MTVLIFVSSLHISWWLNLFFAGREAFAAPLDLIYAAYLQITVVIAVALLLLSSLFSGLEMVAIHSILCFPEALHWMSALNKNLAGLPSIVTALLILVGFIVTVTVSEVLDNVTSACWTLICRHKLQLHWD
jgi:hypothetical protein